MAGADGGTRRRAQAAILRRDRKRCRPATRITLAPLFPAPLRYAHPSAVVALRLALLIANFVGVFSVTIHRAGFAMPAGGAVAAGHVSCCPSATRCNTMQH